MHRSIGRPPARPCGASVRKTRSATVVTETLEDAWTGVRHILVVGVEKCGTTTLHAYLSEHPDISRGPAKEIFFFNKGYERGADWYSGLFDLGNAKAALDATPSYFRSASRQMRRIFGRTRIWVSCWPSSASVARPSAYSRRAVSP